MTGSFNGLTAAQAERLAMLAEEAGEVVQAVGKILRHGYDSAHPEGGPDNGENLEREIADFAAVLHGMIKSGDIDGLERRSDVVWLRKLRFTHHQDAEA